MRRRAVEAVVGYARQRWPLLAFVAVLTAHRATQWGFFVVPAPDFFDFEHTAASLAAGRLPEQFQRAPLYPALMALLAPLVGGERPALVAGQGINLVMSGAALLLMYELCALFVGRWAMVVVMLSGLHWAMAYVTLQPLVEPTLLAAVLAALYLDASGRRGKYAAGGLAAAARYDGLLLIGALAAADVMRGRAAADGARCKSVLPAAGAAAAPTLAWLGVGAAQAALNPYAQVMASQSPAGMEFVRSLALSAISFAPVQVLHAALAGVGAVRPAAGLVFAIAAGLMAAGAMRLVRERRWRGAAAGMLGFAGLYVGLHMLYPAANTRFALPVVWLAHLLAVLGALGVGQVLPAWHPRRYLRGGLLATAALGAAGAAVWAARHDAAWIVPLAGPVALAAAGGWHGRRLAVAAPVTALAVAGSLGLSGWYVQREAAWWAELEPVARWCERPPGGPVRLAATAPALRLIRELCREPRVAFYDLSALDGRAGPTAPPMEVTHVLWSSTDTPAAGCSPQMVLSQRYAREREQVVPTGRWFARRVAAGDEPGWHVSARFAARGQLAVIYERATAEGGCATWLAAGRGE